MAIEIVIAIAGAVTTILGYLIGSINLSKKFRNQRDSESLKSLVDSLTIRGDEIRRLQGRIDVLEAELKAARELGEREIRKVRKANLEQAQELAQFKARCRGCLVGITGDSALIHIASMPTTPDKESESSADTDTVPVNEFSEDQIETNPRLVPLSAMGPFRMND